MRRTAVSRVRPLLVVAAVAAAVSAGSASGATSSQRAPAASPAALAAANQLLAQPWAGLAAQFQNEAQAAMDKLNGHKIIDNHGNGWRFSITEENMKANLG